jgi:DNA-binding transcriptional LysR family regulator
LRIAAVIRRVGRRRTGRRRFSSGQRHCERISTRQCRGDQQRRLGAARSVEFETSLDHVDWHARPVERSARRAAGRPSQERRNTLDGALLLDELDLVIQAALDGAGLAWVAEDRITEHLASGALVRVLEDWCPPFPGFFLYIRAAAQQPAAPAALVDTRRLENRRK